MVCLRVVIEIRNTFLITDQKGNKAINKKMFGWYFLYKFCNKSLRVLKLYILFQRLFVFIIKPMKPKVTFGTSGNTYSIK